MEDQATLSLAQALTENENEYFNENRLSVYLRGSTVEAEMDYNSKTSCTGEAPATSHGQNGQAPAPKGSWVEIAEELAKPIAGNVVQRGNQVRLETLSDTGLVVVFVALLLGVLLPWAAFDIVQTSEDDDDSVYARGGCRLAYNASAVDDSLNAVDDELADVCDAEALAQMRIAAFLGVFTIVWAVRVAVHWGYCYCDYCLAKCASWLYGCRDSSSSKPLDVGEQHKENRVTMAWPHCAILLFLAGQILLENPISAYAYHASGHIEQFTMSNSQRKWQSAGCACMTLAVLLLVDHCHRSAAAEAATAGEVVRQESRIESRTKACMKQGTNPSPGKFLAMALASCWPLFWYGLVIGNADSMFLEFVTSWPSQHRHAVRVVFCSLSLGASLRWMVNAFHAVQAAPYMSHRYENLLLRLVIPPAFLDLIIVTIFADTFVALYITTLILPLFLAYTHLPPGPAELHPITRRRRQFLAKLIARRRAAQAKKRRARRRRAAAAGSGGHSDSQAGRGREVDRHPATATWFMIVKAPMQAKRGLEKGIKLLAGAVGNAVGVDFGVGTQAPFDRDEGDLDDWGGNSLRGAISEVRSSLGLAPPAWEHDFDSSSTGVKGGTSLQDQNKNRGSNHNNTSSEDEDEGGHDGYNPSESGEEEFSSQKLPRKPALCLETALWGAQLSNLAYWDPTGPVPSFLEANSKNVSNSKSINSETRKVTHDETDSEVSQDMSFENQDLLDLPTPSANGAGKLKDDALSGLARHSIHLAAAIHDYGTGTHVHVYVQDHDDESAETSLDEVPKRTRTVWVSFRGTSSAAELFYKDLDTKQMPLKLQSIVSQGQDHNSGDDTNSRRRANSRSNMARCACQCLCRCCIYCVLTATGLGFLGVAVCCCTMCCRPRRDDKDAEAHAHRGFWVAYAAVRIRLFAILSDIVLSEPSQPAPDGSSTASSAPLIAVVFCGHSLGGALASIAALDFNLAMKQGVVLEPLHPEDAAAATKSLAKRQGEVQSPLQDEMNASTTTSTSGASNLADPDPASDAAPHLQQPGSSTDTSSSSTLPTLPSLTAMRKRVACVECLTYGSPRLGDLPLTMLSRRFLPLCWRLVYEGDVITGVPRVHCGPFTCCEAFSPRLCCSHLLCDVREYKHIGTPAFLGRKNKHRVDLLLNPSGVERVAYLKWATSVASHQLRGYLRALLLVAAHLPDLSGNEGHNLHRQSHGRGSELESGISNGNQSVPATSTGSHGNPTVDIELGRRSHAVTWSAEPPSADMDFQYTSAMRPVEPNKE